jgi:hypothetical protein
VAKENLRNVSVKGGIKVDKSLAAINAPLQNRAHMVIKKKIFLFFISVSP